MRFAALLVTLVISTGALAKDLGCQMDKSQEEIITSLFSNEAHVYSLLWWPDPDSSIINARSFIINGHDSVPVFSSEPEAKIQMAGSGYEKDLVGIYPGLLAAILQRMEYAVLNPGGSHPIQFKTCILEPYVRVPSA